MEISVLVLDRKNTIILGTEDGCEPHSLYKASNLVKSNLLLSILK